MRKILVVFFTLVLLNSLFGQEPDTTCIDAEIFCDAQSLEGVWTLPDPFEPELPEKLCETSDGQPNNMLYFGFVPNASTVTIQINPISCTPTNGSNIGYQWGIIEGCDLEDPEYVICDGNPQTLLSNITYNGFEPGHTYFLYVDGYEGSICDFDLNVITGIAGAGNPFSVDEPTHFTNSLEETWSIGDTIDFCKDGYFTTTVHGVTNGNAYLWSSPENGGSSEIIFSSDADTLFFEFTEADSLYKICATALTDCDESEKACFYVNVVQTPSDSLGVFEYCQPEITLGVVPDDWEGSPIKGVGTFYHTITDTITGCTHLQFVTIVAKPTAIGSLDTVLCNLDTLFFMSDTITVDYFEKQYRYEGQAANGCDSLLNFSFQRIFLEAELGELSCLDNGEFGLQISLNNIIPTDYDSIVVDWFKDDIYFYTGATNELHLVIADKGKYNAMVSVFKGGLSCIFELNEIEVDRFISADFSIDTDSICVGDTITVTLNEFNIAAIYEWQSGDEIIEVFPGVYQIIWNHAGDHTLSLKLNYESCVVNSEPINIYVEEKLEKPVINCAGATSDSIAIEWAMVDCATEYEVWMNGTYVTTTQDGNYSFTGLDQDKSYHFEVVALSSCHCPNSTDTISCRTDACPDDIEVFIDQLPIELCSTEFDNDTLLTGYVTGSTGGQLSWSGEIISADGWINASSTEPGEYPITLTYQPDEYECIYEVTGTFELFPELEMENEVLDISCFYNNDGSISVTPLQGEAPFTIHINGNIISSMDTSGLLEGSYELELLDANNCSIVELVEINRPERPEIIINGDTIIERGQNYEYEMSLSNEGYDSVIWYVPELDSILCAGFCDDISYAPLFDQQLCIELFYDGECSIDTCIQLVVNKDVDIYIPNAFTPGKKDGLNDYFMINTNAYGDIRLNTFNIYDRWGELIFHKENKLISSQTDESFGWDGTFLGKTVLQGVYIYYIEVVDTKGNIRRYFGDITLIN